MNLIGTHAPLNEALHGLIARNANDVYGVTLYAVDNEAEYAAPVSSINMRPSDNVNRFVDRVHRTKLKIGQSAAADFSLISDGKGQSRIFDTHTLSHFQVPNSNMVLQIVQDETDRAPFELDDASLSLLGERTQPINDYKTQYGLNWDDVFGLKKYEDTYAILIADVNGYSQYSRSVQSIIEEKIIEMTRSHVSGFPDVEIMQTVGDQFRLRTSVENKKAMKKTFHDIVKSISATVNSDDASFTMRAAIGVGTVSESFNGQHDEIRSGISYKGDVMLRVANQLKAMRRDKTSLVFI